MHKNSVIVSKIDAILYNMIFIELLGGDNNNSNFSFPNKLNFL